MLRFVCCLVLTLLGTQVAQADFNSACEAYEAGQFAEAKKEFTEVLNEGISPALAFNLGCTEVKLGNTANGILWFNRALLQAPRHRESKQNLRQLRQKEGVFVFDESALDDYARYLKPGSWKMIFWICFWIVILCAITLRVWKLKRLWPWITCLSLAFVVTVASGIGWLVRQQQTPPQTLGVVMASDLSLVNAPADTADALISLPAGSLVHPLETRGPWTYLELPGEHGTRGWLRTSNLEKLWPYSASLIE